MCIEYCVEEMCRVSTRGVDEHITNMHYYYYCVVTGGPCVADMNECEPPGRCSQACINTKGSYKCECGDQYVLLPDRHTCKVVRSEYYLGWRGSRVGWGGGIAFSC